MSNAEKQSGNYADERAQTSTSATSPTNATTGTATAMAKDPNALQQKNASEFSEWFNEQTRDNEIVIDYNNQQAKVLNLSPQGLALEFPNRGATETVPFTRELIEQCVIQIAHLLD